MLFMVIERYRAGDPDAVGERFRTQGRMAPDDVVYHGSRQTKLVQSAIN